MSLTVSQLDSITIGPGIALPHTISDLDDDHAVVAAVKVSSAVGSGDEDLYIALVERSGDTLTVVDDDVLAQNMVTASASSLGPWSHRLPGAEKVVVLWWSRDAVGSGTWRLYARTVERAGWSLVLGPATLLYSGGILISLQSGPISSSRFVVWPDATTDYLVCDVAGTTISIAVSAAAPAGYRAASGQHVVVPLGDGERVLCRRSGANTELFVMEVVGTTVTFGAVHVLPADSLELTPDSGPEWVVTRTATTSLFYVTVAGTTITLDDDVTGLATAAISAFQRSDGNLWGIGGATVSVFDRTPQTLASASSPPPAPQRHALLANDDLLIIGGGTGNNTTGGSSTLQLWRAAAARGLVVGPVSLG